MCNVISLYCLCFSVNESACLVCCVSDSVCELVGETIQYRFYLCLWMSKVIYSYMSLRGGSQVFALLMLFLCVILHTMWSGKSLQLLCILPIGILCLFAIRMMFGKIILVVCMLVGIVA